MGSDTSKGEVTQLFVPGGWWKASEMPKDDLLLLDNSQAENLKERLGCLISEVVVPGWTPEQHQFLTEEKVCGRPLFARLGLMTGCERCGPMETAGRHIHPIYQDPSNNKSRFLVYMHVTTIDVNRNLG